MRAKGVEKLVVTLAFAAGCLLMAGCGRPHNQAQPVVDEPAMPPAEAELQLQSAEFALAATNQGAAIAQGPANAVSQQDLLPADPSNALASTNRETAGGEFTQKSMASPFAQAGQALKESYDSILVAIQIGDRDRAISELEVLIEDPDLTPEQKHAVRDLLAQTLKSKAEAVPASGAGAAQASKGGTGQR